MTQKGKALPQRQRLSRKAQSEIRSFKTQGYVPVGWR
jgi:hypothetical protein